MLDGVKGAILGIVKNALNDILYKVVVDQKDEWSKELSDEINNTDSDWVKFRNTMYLSLIEKITAEKNS